MTNQRPYNLRIGVYPNSFISPKRDVPPDEEVDIHTYSSAHVLLCTCIFTFKHMYIFVMQMYSYFFCPVCFFLYCVVLAWLLDMFCRLEIREDVLVNFNCTLGVTRRFEVLFHTLALSDRWRDCNRDRRCLNVVTAWQKVWRTSRAIYYCIYFRMVGCVFRIVPQYHRCAETGLAYSDTF